MEVAIRALRGPQDHNVQLPSQAAYELNMSQRLAKEDPQHQGFPFERTVLHSFDISGSPGMHVCLVYEPMRETLSRFLRRVKGGRFPLPLLKACIRLLLPGLVYLHSECPILHTAKNELCKCCVTK